MKYLLSFTALYCCLMAAQPAAAQTWTSLASDSMGDGFFPGLPDGKGLYYDYDNAADSLWFRIDVFGALDVDTFGLNILIDEDQDPSTGAFWWGSNPFTIDKALTVWVYDSAGTYAGIIGIADSAGVSVFDMTSLGSGNITIITDLINNSYIIGIDRADVFAGNIQADVIAAVGSNLTMNDEIPNMGKGTITETIASAPGSAEENMPLLRISPNPSRGFVHLRMHDLGPEELTARVFDLEGRTIQTHTFQTFGGSVNETIRLEGLQEGIYLVNVVQNGRSWLSKVVLR